MSEVGSIYKVWGNQQGWVSLPRKLRDDKSPKGPNNHSGKWEEAKMFKWPEQKEDIDIWVKDSVDNKYDLYWCPCVFTSPRRVKENISIMNILYADLDNIKPDNLSIRPTMAWESSPERYAAVWLLDSYLHSQDAEQLNKNLTYFIGADTGGWDLTQVLRVPGLRNYKYEGAPKGKLLWCDENHIYNVEKFRSLPNVEMNDLQEVDEFNELLVSDVSILPELVRPFLTKIPAKTLELLFTPEDEIMLHDRSEKLWEIECRLLEAGVSVEDVVKIVAASNWNKYKGRKDETRRIVSEVEKAASQITPHMKSFEMVKKWTPYAELMGQKLDDPGWMIKDVWQRSSHGLIAGEPKTYKSVIVTDMAVSVASGTPFLGKFDVHQKGTVLYIQEENAPWLVQDRLNKIAGSRGLTDGRVTTVSNKVINVEMPPILPLYFMNNCGFNLTSTEDRLLLEESVKNTKPVMIIFDSLYLMLGGVDENSSKDIRPVLEWLLYIRYTYRTSIVVLHHWNKNGKSERGGQRMLGSVLFHAWVESAIYTSIVDEENHEIAIDREFRSFTKPAKLQVQFNMGEPGQNKYEPKLTDVVDIEKKKEEGDALYDLILTYGTATEEELKDALGISRKQLQGRLKKLQESAMVVCVDGVYRAIRKTRED